MASFIARPLITFVADDPPPTLRKRDVDLPVEQQVHTRTYTDEFVAVVGITYQRCGGGRRVIRKKKGGD